METTTVEPDKSKDRTANNECENDRCEGPKSETLPCVECFDPEREYDVGAGE